jgi:hypothetical protein
MAILMITNEEINEARTALNEAVARICRFSGIKPAEALALLVVVGKLEGVPDQESQAWHNMKLFDDVRRHMRRNARRGLFRWID